ncbi:MAG: DNA mismatch repair endonuclease MutL [Elusimicrobiota bacterium]
MPVIHQLPEEVFSRIAAGEVVERPASMLKELLENSLDAGATKIDVEIEGAGIDSLRVVDDGCGMDEADVRTCLDRHATSKIAAFEDLDKLSTFGFRGEALYAISAVSRITITSAPRGAKSGWRVHSVGARVLNGPAPAIPGTTVLVTDLFFNTPARREFLKSAGFERGKLAAVIEEAAIANPGVRFTYKSEGRLVLRFDAENSGDPFQDLDLRAAAVLGDELAGGLLPIDVERPGVRVRMLVSPHDKMPSSRSFQYFFVNKRPVSSRILQQALYKAYGERPGGKHPVCVALLELNPDAFDVNVHPGKREIRFKRDGEMFEIVSGLTASALAKAKAAAPITIEPAGASAVADAPSAPAAESAGAAPRVDTHYAGGRSFFPEEFTQLKLGSAIAMSAPEGAPVWYTPPFRYIGQIERAYLLFEAAGGLFMLDQHAAAERVLYEKLMGEIEHGGAKSQKLMLPVPVALPASATRLVLEKADRLRKIGFDVEAFGKSGLRVTAVPALFAGDEDVKRLIHRVVDGLADPVDEAAALRHDALATVACKAAVKAHDRLGEEEAYKLLDQLKDCKDGSCCPHGRRAMLSLNREELARRFQRPGAVPL